MTRERWRRAEEIYHAALKRSSDSRDAFLQRSCEGDEELLREVRSLLGYEEEAKRLLGEPVAEAATEKLAIVRGACLGPYEIAELLGAGGMGEVYRARDTRLGRDVAVKVLPEHVARDPEALGRFAQETRAVAALNHSRLCALFDIGREGGVDFAVMELLEGETLRQRIARGALSSSKAVELAEQICQGLAAVHTKGIVHRDLKPENLFLTREGIKILDFGLAKDMHGLEASTATTPRTRSGMLLGTVGYLSPEQARGEPADARSDVFALGAVLYEMLSGRRAFQEDTHAETLTAILNQDPPELVSRDGPVPPALERIVRRCLEKDPEDRFQSARDVAFALEAVSGISDASDLGTARRRPEPRARWRVGITLALVTAAALLAGALADRVWQSPRRSARDAPVVRSQIDLTPELRLAIHPPNGYTIRRQVALSPDGTLLVWGSFRRDDPTATAFELHGRRLDTGEVTRIADRGTMPFFSPDSRWIGFFEAGAGAPFRLRKVPVEGGLATDLAEIPDPPMDATWGSDGRIYLGSVTRGLRWIPAEGGSATEITTVDRTREVGHRLPHLLPGGRELLFTTMPSYFGVRARVEVVSLASGARKVVVDDAADARYLPSGHVVFVRQGVLMAAPFDLSRLELAAPPVPVLEGVSQALNFQTEFLNSGAGQYSVSDSGLLTYAPGGIVPDVTIEVLLVDQDGHSEPLPGFDRPRVSPQFDFSPDGRRLAFVEQEGPPWLFDVERQTHRPLKDRGIAVAPRWSPDGTRLALGWSEAGPLHLWIAPLGRGDWQRLTEGEHPDMGVSWHPDGRFLAFLREGPSSDDILVYRFEDGQVVPFLTTKADERFPEFSPDGRWLAYTSDESGRWEVYVTSFPDREQTLAVSSSGGWAPLWSRDGSRLFYFEPGSSGGRRMMAVSVAHRPELSLGIPSPLFPLPEGVVTMGVPWYELHPDGRRFLMGRRVKTDPPPPTTRLHLVQSWFAELERLVPTGR